VAPRPLIASAGLRYLPTMTTMPLILDVDTGIDDSLAILYAAATPEAELVAVTCVGGNVEAHQVERNTRSILELAGRTDVEVALGRDRPLVKALETTPETHGPQGLGHAELPPSMSSSTRLAGVRARSPS
jgi:purine nucleosidase